MATRRVGVWIIGALGGIGTTVVVGARAIARGLVSEMGLSTSRPGLVPAGLVPVADLVFGGHEVRSGTLSDSARQIAKQSGSIDLDLLASIRSELDGISAAIQPGTSIGCGPAIEQLITDPRVQGRTSLREVVDRLRADIGGFRSRERAQFVVVVNLASTEPDLQQDDEPSSVAELERVLDDDCAYRVRPSLLYAYAALREGCAYLNFTPSQAALGPALQDLGHSRGVPFMGNDGKTGETLVKSALAPMFKHRSLNVLSWQGYNILGDRDGQILSHKENLASKVRTKDSVVQSILGYPLHTHVGIDYVPSLDDRKTAWDFIHFQGFLEHKMSMQFTWQGCDSILAAPLVLDMVRFADLSHRLGEVGPMPHLACYFKSPLGVQEHDLHGQVQMLAAYLRKLGVESL